MNCFCMIVPKEFKFDRQCQVMMDSLTMQPQARVCQSYKKKDFPSVFSSDKFKTVNKKPAWQIAKHFCRIFSKCVEEMLNKSIFIDNSPEKQRPFSTSNQPQLKQT